MTVSESRRNDPNVGRGLDTGAKRRNGWRGWKAAVMLVALSFGAVTTTSAQIFPTDSFYVPPDPLPPGEPGDVIRSRTIIAPAFLNAVTRQIMYRSKTNAGKPVAVTGAVLTPLLPAANRPLVVVTPGTRGTGDQCAPSKQFSLTSAAVSAPEYETGTIQQLLARGIAVVVTDYEGAGTPGLPAYLVGLPEGYNGLDALRAAQRLPGSGLPQNGPVGVAGYSQGGGAGGWVAELQPTYAPELNFRGALVGGTPTDMLAEVNHLNGNPTAGAGFALASLSGLDHAFPELKLDERLTELGRQVMRNIRAQCVVEYLTLYGSTSSANVTQPDVLADPQWQDRYRRSLLGTKAPGAPAYIYHGTADTIVPFFQGQLLFNSWCVRGADVMFDAQVGLEHVTASVSGTLRGIEWLAQRLAGIPAPQGCFDVTIP